MLRRYVVTMSLCVLSLAMQACSPTPHESVEKLPVARPVKMLTVKQASIYREIKLPAVIQANATAQMAFQVGGKLDKPLIKEGTEVVAGTQLARLEQQEFQNRLDTAQAQFDSARDEYNRAKRLIKTNAVSKSLLEQRRTQYEVTRAALNSAQKNFTDSILRAPFDGVVSEVNVEAFQTVGAQQVILTIQSVGMSDAIVQIPADLVIQSKQFDFRKLTVALDAAPGILLPGTLGPFMATTETGSQSYQAKIHFDPPAHLTVLPGMTGQVSIEVFNVRDQTDLDNATVVTVPLSALLSDEEGHYVWKIDPASMTTQRQTVVLDDDAVGAQLRVVQGLVPGDQIAISGVHTLMQHMLVSRFAP